MKTGGIKKGQSMVELAIIIPFFFIMLLVLFDVGRAVLDYAIINTAVREGTRFAIVQPGGGDPGLIKQKVQSYLFNIKDLDPDSIIISNYGDEISIQVSYPFKTVVSGVVAILGIKPLSINVRSEMSLAPLYK